MAVANTRRGSGHGPELGATEARQGRPGFHILWILILSTALAAIALFILLAIQAPSLSGPGGQVAVPPPAASASTPPSQSKPANPAAPN